MDYARVRWNTSDPGDESFFSAIKEKKKKTMSVQNIHCMIPVLTIFLIKKSILFLFVNPQSHSHSSLPTVK